MDLAQLTAPNSPVPLIVAVLGLVLACVGIAIASKATRRAGRLEARYQALMTGVNGEDLASALEAYVARVNQAVERVGRLEGRSDRLDERLKAAVRHVRILRYSAFDDAGGDQSFSIALLDDAADGIVLSGLHGRGAMKVYAKPIQAGRSTHGLSAEEQRAVAEAGGGIAAD